MMNDAIKEQISAYVDGELTEAESALLVRRLSQDAELRALAAQYLSIGRAVRGEAMPAGLDSLRSRVAAGIDNADAVAEGDERDAGPKWMRPVAGIGIAATVAAVALLGLQSVGPSPSETPTFAGGVQEAVAIDDAPFYTEPPIDEALSDQPNEMLRRYYQQHNDSGGSGILDRLVTLELRDTELESAADDDEIDDSDGADDRTGAGPDIGADGAPVSDGSPD